MDAQSLKSLIYENRTYNLEKQIPNDSPLVAEEKLLVLGSLNLDGLVKDLSNCGELIYLAYNGAADYHKIRVPLLSLHADYSKICEDSQETLKKIMIESGKLQNNLIDAISCIFDDDLDSARELLAMVADNAKVLHDEALNLSNRFDELSNRAKGILTNAETTQGLEKEKIATIETALSDLEKNKQKADELAQRYGKQRADLEKYYNEAKEEAAAADSRAFGLAITSAIMGPLGTALGAFGGAYVNPVGTTIKQVIPPALDKLSPPEETKEAQENAIKKKEAQDKLNQAQQETKKATSAWETAKNDIAEREGDVTSAKDKVKIAEQTLASVDAAKKEEATKELEKCKQLLITQEERLKASREKGIQLEKDVEDKKNNEKKIGALLDGLSKAMKEASEKLDKMADNYNQIAAKYREEKMQYFNLMMEKENQEIEQRGLLRGYMVQIETYANDKKNIEVSLNSLFLSIGALKIIVTTLTTAAYFWKQLADALERLSNPDLNQKFEIWAKKATPEQRLKQYSSYSFKLTILKTYAAWKALEVICQEYFDKIARVGARVAKNFRENLPPEMMRAQAAELAKTLLTDAADAMADSALKKREIDAQIANVNAEIKANEQ